MPISNWTQAVKEATSSLTNLYYHFGFAFAALVIFWFIFFLNAYVKKFWHGDVKLWLSYWVAPLFCWPGIFLFVGCLAALLTNLYDHFGFATVLPIPEEFIKYPFILVFSLVFGGVGFGFTFLGVFWPIAVWRSAGKYQGKSHWRITSRFIAGLTPACLLFSIFSAKFFLLGFLATTMYGTLPLMSSVQSIFQESINTSLPKEESANRQLAEPDSEPFVVDIAQEKRVPRPLFSQQPIDQQHRDYHLSVIKKIYAERGLLRKNQRVEDRTLKTKNKLLYDRNEDVPFTGEHVQWHKDGSQKSYSFLKDGKPHSVAKTWYVNGQVKLQEWYQDGELHGVAQAWHINGKRWLVARYRVGKLDGPYREWDAQGNVVKQITYKNGVEVSSN